ncbi:MAG TPA: hypothetical protein PK992_18725 [Planctomycetaceae bacterium]|nr:hypothetical protein [Planctomycetaceae bacterium]
MKIIESAQKRNPEQIARNMYSIVDQLKSAVESSAIDGNSFDSVERKAIECVLQIGFQAAELLLALQGDGNLGDEIQTADAKISRRSEATSTTRLRSIFGEHSFEQFTYASGKNKPVSLRPISARLSLPAGRWSFLLQEFSQMLGVDQAYDQAMKISVRFSVATSASIRLSESTETWAAVLANSWTICRCQKPAAKRSC